MSKKSYYDFPFIGGAVLEERLDIRSDQRAVLQQQLKSPLYWFQVPHGRKICWNWRLIRDYLMNGPGPKHNRLIEEYLASLEAPNTQAASSKQLQEVK